ncbi:hypothetical protein HDU67_010292 [Dinochytrium kinnereticum]|nr:hypothetical protein HDU67_010292 [Dinochytrium kinnereticum]
MILIISGVALIAIIIAVSIWASKSFKGDGNQTGGGPNPGATPSAVPTQTKA